MSLLFKNVSRDCVGFFFHITKGMLKRIPAFVHKEGKGRGLVFALAASGAVVLHPTCVCCVNLFYSVYMCKKKLSLNKQIRGCWDFNRSHNAEVYHNVQGILRTNHIRGLEILTEVHFYVMRSPAIVCSEAHRAV